jgi:DUF438 domain-containing protein
MSRIPTAEEITANWGERCPDYGEGCPCCEMWSMHDEIERLRKALETIASETEVHTKLNQERLCCKFQHIARAALDAIKEG